MKKILTVLMISLCVVISLVGCAEVDGLSEYKTQAKEAVASYAISKGEDNYTKANWEAILQIVEDGKANIDKAEDKAAVDNVVSSAKQAIDEVNKKIVHEDLREVIVFSGWNVSNKYPQTNTITINSKNEKAVFELNTDNGSFAKGSELKEITLGANQKVNWNPGYDEYGDPLVRFAFIQVTVKSEENIIGYALIELYQYHGEEEELDDDGCRLYGSSFQPIIVDYEFYPMLNDEYQDITNEDIVTKMQAAKDYYPIIDEDLYERIKQDQNQQPDFPTSIDYMRFFGEYNGTAVFFWAIQTIEAEQSSIISGIKFGYRYIFEFIVWNNGQFYNLIQDEEEIMLKGILTQRDLEIMGALLGKLNYK